MDYNWDVGESHEYFAKKKDPLPWILFAGVILACTFAFIAIGGY